MQAGERSLLEILGRQSRQYRVPLFQRRYVWDQDEWSELWDDLCDLVRDPVSRSAPLFLGSVVTQQGDGALKSITPWLVIDGQQRLTTFEILLKALKDHVVEDPDVLASLNTYLRNPSSKGDDVHRVWPSQSDQPHFRAVFAAKDPKSLRALPGYAPPKGRTLDRRSLIVRAYEFFHERISELIVNRSGAVTPSQEQIAELVGTFLRALAGCGKTQA